MSSIFSQTIDPSPALTGIELCDSMYSFVRKNGFNPQVQSLAAGGINNLPYNIIVRFTPKDIESEHNFILFFYMEDSWQNKDLLITVFDALKEQKYNSTVVLSFGNRIPFQKENVIYGCDIFAQSLDSNTLNSVVLLDLSASKNSIITGSNKKHSPSWMLKDMFDAYSNAKITEGLPLFFISQVADYTFSEDKAFLTFLNADIPCISAGIKDASKAQEVILSLIDSYENSRTNSNDSHTFMFRLFGKRFWFSELRLIKAIIIFFFLGFLLVFALGIANKNLKIEFWKEIRANWYVIPSIFLITLGGFFAGKGLYTLFVPSDSTNYTVFGFIILEIMISLLLVSVFYMLNLSLLKKYTTRSLDFLLVVDTFINLILFTLIDISLFPIMLLIYIVSIISLIFRRNWIHIILFLFLIIPFIPYINALFNTSDRSSLHNMLLHSILQPFVMSFLLLPVYLMQLRLFNALKKYYTKKRLYATAIGIAYILITCLLLLTNRIFYSDKKDRDKNTQNILGSNNPNINFDLKCRDRKIFSDTIRTINLSMSEAPVYVSLRIESSQDDSTPVLYSENDFIMTKQNVVDFQLPLYPSKKLEFSYGSDKSEQKILAEAVFYNQWQNYYYSLFRELIIEGEK
ncbi:MAG: hypothetical protein K5907_07950 [Treponema sp.]|nr:hypothetical protein [Treponema sp.]